MDVDPLGARFAAGDEAAFEECYAAIAQTVLLYLRRHVGADDAEDVLQRTFLDVWRGAARYDPRQSLSGWVFTIAKRRAVFALRSRRPGVVSLDVLRDIARTLDVPLGTVKARMARGTKTLAQSVAPAGALQGRGGEVS